MVEWFTLLFGIQLALTANVAAFVTFATNDYRRIIATGIAACALAAWCFWRQRARRWYFVIGCLLVGLAFTGLTERLVRGYVLPLLNRI